ncbi:hypothetical protein PYH37_005223 [Sinorhizobium numidicum]|uniref:Uncharacterized protein n=1 Tax=Sinorhizobium numidicum TaxID=680248 RepID=A0ABY8D054_9HYPH|nr:hypothetical protein [Sinorhizobium numidicum]WEX76872.1 hypothetical protein PYH37_005223 [Sinorhizobium numidicum]WEX83532.1 hypothetical protein PYH38_002316 [Sinorhizobium numidicum]
MTENSKIPPAKRTIEDPPEYAAASGEATWSGRGKAAEAESQEGLRGQLKWNEQRSGETEAAPSSSDAVTQPNSPHASEATMRYNPRDSAEDRAQEDPPVAGDPINQADPAAGQSRATSDDHHPSTKFEAVTSEAGHVASGGIGGIKNT